METDSLSALLLARMDQLEVDFDWLCGKTGLPMSLLTTVIKAPYDVPLDRLVNVAFYLGLRLNIEFV